MTEENGKITYEGGVVKIPKNERAYANILRDALKEVPPNTPLTAEQSVRMEKALTDLAVPHSVSADGKVSTVIMNIYFDFRTVLFDSLKVAAKAAFAVPAHDVIGMVDAAISAFEMACTRFSLLRPHEVTIYWALVEIEHAQREAGTQPGGATAADIKREIAKTLQPPNDDQMESGLSHLVELGTLQDMQNSGGFLVTEKWVR
jgi:hypothetical protein